VALKTRRHLLKLKQIHCFHSCMPFHWHYRKLTKKNLVDTIQRPDCLHHHSPLKHWSISKRPNSSLSQKAVWSSYLQAVYGSISTQPFGGEGANANYTPIMRGRSPVGPSTLHNAIHNLFKSWAIPSKKHFHIHIKNKQHIALKLNAKKLPLRMFSVQHQKLTL
jgi:hypothetical protein